MAIYVYTDIRPGGIAHIPSQQEYEDLKSIMNGLNLTTGDAYKQKLHMPFVGYRGGGDASSSNQGSGGYYWLSTPYSPSDPKYGRYILITSSNVGGTHRYRSFGYGVRLFLDEYREPDNTRTVEAGTLGNAGIFHNADLGVISVTNGTDKSITMYDKNVGATIVYNSGDTLSESNCGKYFQRGNYYGFPFTGSVTTSTTKVDTTGYGGNNPYSSSTFITQSSDDRSNPSNDNLRTDSGENYFVLS